MIYNDSEEEINQNLHINTRFYSPNVRYRGNEVIYLKPTVYRTEINDGIVLGLRQICLKIPKCAFISLKDNVTIKEEPKTDETCCNECGEELKSPLQQHFLGENRPIDESLRCTVCNLILTTKCSLKAHQRLHTDCSPYVCPDCGIKFQTRDDLNRHDDEKCCHQSKSIRYRCPVMRCGKLFSVSSTFATHLHLHIQQLYQCNLCKTIFNQMEDFEKHKSMHSDEKCKINNLKFCNVCKKSVVDSLETHIDTHATDITKQVYIFICKNCRNHFRSITTYILHKLSKKCSKNGNKSTEVYRYVIKECTNCKERIICKDDKSIKGCTKCQSNQLVNKTLEPKFMCILCNQTISASEKILHTKRCKYARTYVRIQRMDITKYLVPQLKRKRKKTLNLPAKRLEIDTQLAEPVKFSGIYACKTCNYKNVIRDEFHEHIRTHRDISTAYQCMECGECFVVKPSLVKHLKHFHNINDSEQYFEQNQCFDKEAVKELEEAMKLTPGEVKGPLKENQCRVCREEFENSTELNKHFRIHGMAFLMRNSK